MICPRCCKNTGGIHTCTPSDGWRKLETELAALKAETTKLKLDLLISYGEAAELSGKAAELEKALRVARDALIEYSKGVSGAIAKIDEVLK